MVNGFECSDNGRNAVNTCRTNRMHINKNKVKKRVHRAEGDVRDDRLTFYIDEREMGLMVVA
jgi:hypothetical protein